MRKSFLKQIAKYILLALLVTQNTSPFFPMAGVAVQKRRPENKRKPTVLKKRKKRLTLNQIREIRFVCHILSILELNGYRGARLKRLIEKVTQEEKQSDDHPLINLLELRDEHAAEKKKKKMDISPLLAKQIHRTLFPEVRVSDLQYLSEDEIKPRLFAKLKILPTITLKETSYYTDPLFKQEIKKESAQKKTYDININDASVDDLTYDIQDVVNLTCAYYDGEALFIPFQVILDNQKIPYNDQNLTKLKIYLQERAMRKQDLKKATREYKKIKRKYEKVQAKHKKIKRQHKEY